MTYRNFVTCRHCGDKRLSTGPVSHFDVESEPRDACARCSPPTLSLSLNDTLRLRFELEQLAVRTPALDRLLTNLNS